MQINECIELLEIKVPYNENELKKAYYKKCLIYHPDKNKNGLEMFKKVQEAYEKLKKYDIKEYKKGTFNKFCEEENINELSYVELLNKYINSFSNKYGWSNDFIKNSIEKLLINAQDVSLKFYEHLELEKSLEIYEYISKYSELFNIGGGLLEKMNKVLKDKIKDEKIVILNPCMRDIINDNIYVLELGEDKFYVPLWHNELYYKNDYIVRIIPDLEKNIYIDDENNIHISIYKEIKELIELENIELDIGGKEIKIKVNELLIKKYQVKVLKNEGISKINEKDIFKNKERGNILVHIHISNK